jgi:hypothetical protein
MLDKYLATSPTITEKLPFPWAPGETAGVVADKGDRTKEFLGKWQASWEKKA